MKNSLVWLFVVAVLVCVVGCNAKQSSEPPITRLHLGMQKYEVEEIYGKQLAFVSIEPIPDTNGYSKGVYRLWPYKLNDPKNAWEGIGDYLVNGSPKYQTEQAQKRTTPFKLTFVIYPPLTADQCKLLVAKNNTTEPNEIAQIMALEGYRINQLIKIEEDTTRIAIDTVRNQTQVIRENSDHQSQQLGQIQQQLEQQRNEQSIQRSQDEFWRMQQQNRNTFTPDIGGSYQWTDGQGNQHGHIPIKGTSKSIDY